MLKSVRRACKTDTLQNLSKVRNSKKKEEKKERQNK